MFLRKLYRIVALVFNLNNLPRDVQRWIFNSLFLLRIISALLYEEQIGV